MYITCDITSAEHLKDILAMAEREGLAVERLGANRVAFIGKATATKPPAEAHVRVKGCPGCKRRQQDVDGMIRELERRYRELALERKVKIAISGCRSRCEKSEDIGIFASRDGWTIWVRGEQVGEDLSAGALFEAIDHALEQFRS